MQKAAKPKRKGPSKFIQNTLQQKTDKIRRAKESQEKLKKERREKGVARKKKQRDDQLITRESGRLQAHENKAERITLNKRLKPIIAERVQVAMGLTQIDHWASIHGENGLSGKQQIVRANLRNRHKELLAKEAAIVNATKEN